MLSAMHTAFRCSLVLPDPQRAAVKAVEDALEKTSLPAVLEFVPGGFEGVRIKTKIAVPNPVRLLGCSHLMPLPL